MLAGAMNEEARQIITQLALAPLPDEGGWFRRTWTSPVRLADGRAAGSAIYFLVTPEDFSALHRLATDEVWLSHAGDALEHVTLDAAGGAARVTRLGGDVGRYILLIFLLLLLMPHFHILFLYFYYSFLSVFFQIIFHLQY